jgi:acyl-coenzyme A synthetase/AMP-(fatty) acid ligase
MHPVEMLNYWARVSPERPALMQSSMVITYHALAGAVAACADRIRSCNFDPGQPVALAIADPTKLLVASLAFLRNGMTCALVGQDVVAQLPSAGIANLVYSGVSPLLPNGNCVAFDDTWLVGHNRIAPAAAATPAGSGADLIFFTSGTTGTPKKVVVPTAALLARTALAGVSGEARFNKVMVAPGLASAFAFTRAASLVAAGKTIVFAGDVSHPLRLVETFRVDSIVASPQQALTLVEMIEAEPGYRLESLREIRIGGGALSPDLGKRVQSLLCRQVVTEYGATEAGLVAFAPYESVRDTQGAVGFVVPGTRIEIVDDNHRPVPIGEEGFIRGQSTYIQSVYGANTGRGTNEDEEAWWFPGDIGRLTARGMLCIGGRIDDLINCGGVKRSAVMLDEVVRRFPGVRDGAVCATRGEGGVDEVWIGIASDVEVDVHALRQFVEASERYQLRVGLIRRVANIPRNNLGKLQRHELKALLVAAADFERPGMGREDAVLAGRGARA